MNVHLPLIYWRAIPISLKKIVPGGRHGFMLEFKKECLEIILEFLKENSFHCL
jgi:pimeloyl-ACP methyl ester carboxylesterase